MINPRLMPGMPGWKPDPYSLASIAASSPGRPCIWPDTDALARDWKAYVRWARANPMPIGRRGRTQPRPLTATGFCAHCGHSRTTWYEALKRGDDVAGMAQRIDSAMKAGLTEGALVGAFKEAITSRIVGLADKQEVSATVATTSDTYDLSNLSDEDLETLDRILSAASSNTKERDQ